MIATQASQLPVRPPMPTPEDQARAAMQEVRWAMLTAKWECYLAEFMETRVDADRLKSWGPADTSVNTLADLSRQYSTPGLYGARPKMIHADAAGQLVTGAGGYLAQSGYWTRMAWVQYMTVGMGDFFLHHAVVDGGLVHRTVRPQDVFLVAHPQDPGRTMMLWELRLRFDPRAKAQRYFWDVYDLGETRDDVLTGKALEEVRPPSFRIVEGDRSEAGIYGDVSHLFGLPTGGLVGPAYVWRRIAGAPRLPYTHYRSADAGTLWNVYEKRDAAVGTLTVAQAWTYTHASARDATGRAVIAAGMKPLVTDVKDAGEDTKIVSVTVKPGTILYHETEPGMQPFVQEVGPGVEVSELVAYAERVEERQAVRWGLSASDVAKSGTDPQSGAALLISRQAKREYADKVKPLFLAADLETLALVAILFRQLGVVVPEEGYSIEYAEIALSAEEKSAQRDEIDWEMEHDMLSPVEAYRRLHPGLSEADARAKLIAERIAAAQFEADVKVALAAAGLEAPAPPSLPPPSPGGSPTPPIPPPAA